MLNCEQSINENTPSYLIVIIYIKSYEKQFCISSLTATNVQGGSRVWQGGHKCSRQIEQGVCEAQPPKAKAILCFRAKFRYRVVLYTKLISNLIAF